MVKSAYFFVFSCFDHFLNQHSRVQFFAECLLLLNMQRNVELKKLMSLDITFNFSVYVVGYSCMHACFWTYQVI